MMGQKRNQVYHECCQEAPLDVREVVWLYNPCQRKRLPETVQLLAGTRCGGETVVWVRHHAPEQTSPIPPKRHPVPSTHQQLSTWPQRYIQISGTLYRREVGLTVVVTETVDHWGEGEGLDSV